MPTRKRLSKKQNTSAKKTNKLVLSDKNIGHHKINKAEVDHKKQITEARRDFFKSLVSDMMSKGK